MLIGISGKIGTGKDTVAKIIQFLMFEEKLKQQGKQLVGSEAIHHKVFMNWDDKQRSSWSGFSIEKYAGALKDMMCTLIGCTREQLEDHDFKNTELPEEWWYWIAEVPHSNKKGMVRTGGMFLTEQEAARYHTEVLNYNPKVVKTTLVKPTPRLLLQLLGTECGRDILHPNTWVNALYSRYTMRMDYDVHRIDTIPIGEGKFKVPSHHPVPEKYWGGIVDLSQVEWHTNTREVLPNWIITDVRFPNELKALKDREGISIRVERFVNPQLDVQKGIPLCDVIKNQQTKEHPSETALDDARFDYLIINDSDIENLVESVRQVLMIEKFINDTK